MRCKKVILGTKFKCVQHHELRATDCYFLGGFVQSNLSKPCAIPSITFLVLFQFLKLPCYEFQALQTKGNIKKNQPSTSKNEQEWKIYVRFEFVSNKTALLLVKKTLSNAARHVTFSICASIWYQQKNIPTFRD